MLELALFVIGEPLDEEDEEEGVRGIDDPKATAGLGLAFILSFYNNFHTL